MRRSAFIKSSCLTCSLFAVLTAILLVSCGGNSSQASSANAAARAALSTVVTGLTVPLDLQQPNDDSGRIFIVEQGGTIQVVKNGALLSAPFLDLSAKVHMEDETGLLGMAFHPDMFTTAVFS